MHQGKFLERKITRELLHKKRLNTTALNKTKEVKAIEVPKERNVLCADCKVRMRRHTPSRRSVYRCPTCACTHAAKSSGKPEGYPADQGTRTWRMKAQNLFQRFWISGRSKRSTSRKRLAAQLGLKSGYCRISNFDIAQCQKTIQLCEAVRSGQLKGPHKRRKRGRR